MSQRVDKGQIVKFQHDRDILPYDDVFIAEKMRMAKSNYSNYINGRIPISKAFLKKFYTAFGDEIEGLYKIQGRSMIAAEDDQPYESHQPEGGLITELSKQNEALESKYDQLAKSHHKIVIEIHNLEEKIDQVLKERLNKIELLLSNLLDQKKNLSKDIPDNIPPSHKHKKKPGG